MYMSDIFKDNNGNIVDRNGRVLPIYTDANGNLVDEYNRPVQFTNPNGGYQDNNGNPGYGNPGFNGYPPNNNPYPNPQGNRNFGNNGYPNNYNHQGGIPSGEVRNPSLMTPFFNDNNRGRGFPGENNGNRNFNRFDEIRPNNPEKPDGRNKNEPLRYYAKKEEVDTNLINFKITNRGDDMDRTKHELSEMGGLINEDFGNKTKSIKESVDKYLKSSVHKDKKTKFTSKEFRDNLKEVHDNLSSFVEKCNCNQLTSDEYTESSDDPVSGPYLGLILNSIPTKTDITEDIFELGGSSNLRSIARNLLLILKKYKDVNSFMSKDIKKYCRYVNSYLTREINNFFTKEMLVDVTIDDFLLDIDDLIKYVDTMEVDQGIRFYEFSQNFLYSNATLFNDDNFKFEYDNYSKLGLNKGVFPYFTIVNKIDLSSSTLGIDSYDSLMIITQKKDEFLYNLLTSFRDYDLYHKLARFTEILVTSDNYRYRVWKNSNGFILKNIE